MVFCPNTVTPTFGDVVIGLTLALYKSSLLVLVNFLSARIALLITPRVFPAGAFQTSADESLNAYIPGINVEAGTQIC